MAVLSWTIRTPRMVMVLTWTRQAPQMVMVFTWTRRAPGMVTRMVHAGVVIVIMVVDRRVHGRSRIRRRNVAEEVPWIIHCCFRNVCDRKRSLPGWCMPR